jgi:UDP-GlcNAc:undecaprenyl-phosphate GlcNAc-1-phosphate transferase
MELDKYAFWVFVGQFINVVVFSILINSLLLRFVKTLGVRDNTNVVRWSSKRKPAIGGIGFFIIFLLCAGSYGVFFVPTDLFRNPQALGLIVFTCLAFLMGLADDAYDTRPYLKFLVQFICGIGCAYTDQRINIFELEALNVIITVFWVVGVMNSINMLDNMDAITTSVSIFVCLSALVVMNVSQHSSSFDFYITIGVLGALVGFLFFNWYPSKMFMGDTGSQFLGFFLAALGIKYFWNATDFFPLLDGKREFLLAVLVFLLPLTDTTTVFFSRIMQKKSPFVGGKDHTTHNLSYLGLSDSQVAFVFIGVSLVGIMATFALVSFPDMWGMPMLLSYSGFIVLVFLTMFLYSVNNNLKRARGQKK